jgi:hypothetical protein
MAELLSRSWITSRKGCSSPSCITKFLACCATQAPLGLEVQAMYSFRRVASEMKSSTEIRCRKAVSTVRKSQASALAACCRRNARNDERARSGVGCRPTPSSTFRTDVGETATPRPLSSPTIPPAPPVGILTRESKDQRAQRLFKRQRPPLRVRIRPASREKLTMLTQHVSGFVEKLVPRPPRKGSTQRREQRAVSCADLRPALCRRRIASSCHRTKISSSCERRDRASSGTSANRLRTARYTNDHNKRGPLPLEDEKRPDTTRAGSHPRRKPRISLRTLRGGGAHVHACARTSLGETMQSRAGREGPPGSARELLRNDCGEDVLV